MVRAGLQRDALRYEAVAVASCSGIIKQKGEGQGQLDLSIRCTDNLRQTSRTPELVGG